MKPLDEGQILRNAADIIEARGLAKWVNENEQGCVCTAQALLMAHGVRIGGEIPTAVHAAMKRLQAFVMAPCCICCWNNEPQRTAADVVATLRAAATDTAGTMAWRHG